MSETQTRTVTKTVVQTLLGSLVVLLTVPTGVGPVAGGWLAGRGTRHQRNGVAASTVAGLLGAFPWAVVVFLATRGAIESIGYHKGVVHVGVLTASPGTFVLWQEVGLAVVFTVLVVGISVAGGVLSVLSGGGLWDRHGEQSQ